jgi:hypothetical protein
VQGQRGINKAKWICKTLYKGATKGFAKTLLKSHRDDAMDADILHEFQRVLSLEGLPENVDELDGSGPSTAGGPQPTEGGSFEPPRHSMPV